MVCTFGLLIWSALPLVCIALQSQRRLQSSAAPRIFFCSSKGHFKSPFDLTCVCNPGWTGYDCSVRAKPPHNVSAACYTPGGSNGVATCEWYSKCLSKRFPGCKDHALEYAESYGGKYCERFTNVGHKFSSNGQVWVDKVKLCLQEQLVKDVMPLEFEVADCAQIRSAAFNSHPKCYLEPDPSNTSIGMCSLLKNNPGDIVKILETTWDALFSKESVMQMIDVAKGCAHRSLLGIARPRLEQDGYREVADMIN